MKSALFLILASTLLAFAGCSTPSKTDSGTIHGRTFSFVSTGARTPPANTDTRAIVHSTIQEAVTGNLGSRGLAHVNSGGDVIVGYLLIVGNNVSTTSIDDYFGLGRESDELHEKAHKAYTSGKNPNYFEAGTLVIDLIDGKSFKLLRRKYATRPILNNPTPEMRTERIRGVVDEIFKDLRVSQ